MIDTSGWAFMYPLLRLSGVRVACYTHYPTISTDMLKRVQTRQAAFNNSSSIASSTLKSAAKVVYYYMFATLYGAVGGCANVSCALITQTLCLTPPLLGLQACKINAGVTGGTQARCSMCAGGDGQLIMDARPYTPTVVDAARPAACVPTVQCHHSVGAPTGSQAKVPVPRLLGPVPAGEEPCKATARFCSGPAAGCRLVDAYIRARPRSTLETHWQLPGQGRPWPCVSAGTTLSTTPCLTSNVVCRGRVHSLNQPLI